MSSTGTVIREMDAATLKSMLDAGDAILIDVREPMEYTREHIIGARHVPLSGFDMADFSGERDKVAVFHCASGRRTEANAQRILATGFEEIYHLKGGLTAWKAAGLPVHLNRNAPIDLMRQVQIAAGSLVLAGVILGFLLSPWFFALSGFVGAGLTFAGVTGFCGLARILAVAPWNRVAPVASSPG